MAQDYQSLIMKDGAKLFTAKPAKPDRRPEDRRKKLLAQLDKVVAGNPPRGWVQERNDVALCSLRSGKNVVRFPGGGDVQTSKSKRVFGAVVEKERVTDFYQLLRTRVEDKSLDGEIAAAWGDAPQGNLLRELEGQKQKRVSRQTPEEREASNRKRVESRRANRAKQETA